MEIKFNYKQHFNSIHNNRIAYIFLKMQLTNKMHFMQINK